MLPFRSCLSELDWIALEHAKRKKRIVWYFHVSPFVTKVCDKKYTYRLKIHFLRKKKRKKKKRNNIQRYPDTENKFTSHITNVTENSVLFCTNRSNSSKDAHTRQKHDTINWFSTRATLHRSQATRASIERYLEGHRSCNSSNCFESTTTRPRPPRIQFLLSIRSQLGRVLES